MDMQGVPQDVVVIERVGSVRDIYHISVHLVVCQTLLLMLA